MPSDIRKLNICFDLDGTILEYDHWRGPDHFGKVIKEAVEFINKLNRPGGLLQINDAIEWQGVLFTTRQLLPEEPRLNILLNLLKTAGIDLDFFIDVNASMYDEIDIGQWVHNPKNTSIKPIADVYIDDRSYEALAICPTGGKIQWNLLYRACENIERLYASKCNFTF